MANKKRNLPVVYSSGRWQPAMGKEMGNAEGEKIQPGFGQEERVLRR